MAILDSRDVLKRYNKSQSYQLGDIGERRYSASALRKSAGTFAQGDRYDIFLSHSYDDARVVRQIRDMLIEHGFSVYVDWIEDGDLDRASVTELTAMRLRARMQSCSSLIYLTSHAAESSVWMPWELGYMDALTRRVAVAPILDEDGTFEGREFLGVYPYLDLTGDSFYIHRDSTRWVTIKKWAAGQKP